MGSQDPNSPNGNDELIARLYDVALDPARYEDLLDHWEQTIGPMRGAQLGPGMGLLDDASIREHFARADQFLDKIAENEPRDERKLLIAHFDKVAALLFSNDLKIDKLNPSAELALEVTEGQSLYDLPIDDTDRRAFGDRVAQILHTRSDEPVVFRVRSTTSGRFIVFHMHRCVLKDSTPLVVAITSEVHWPPRFGGILKSAFEFTKAEIDVVRLLIECCSLKEIAEKRERSIDTVRAQLKSILAKTETNSQIELVRLIISMMDIAGHTQSEADGSILVSAGAGQLKELPFRSVETADGRRVDYLILGDTTGNPCVFLPLDFGLVRWPAQAEAAAFQQRLKVIVPVRAGYGSSSPLPRKAKVAETFCDALRVILQTLGVTRCPLVTLGSDSFLGFHFAQAHPEMVSGMIACAGTLPLTRAEQYDRMEKWHRFILAGARYTPHLLPFLVKAGFALARRLGKRGFVQSVYCNSPADVAAIEDDEIFVAIAIGSEVALSQEHSAHEAFARQASETERTNWRPVVEASIGRFPITFMNGDQDPEVPKETLAEFVESYEGINFEIYENEGQLIFFRKWPLVLKKLTEIT